MYVASSAALVLPTFFTSMRSVWNEQDFAGLDSHRLPSLEPILQLTLDDVDELFARMVVPGCGDPGWDIDAHLDDLDAVASALDKEARPALAIQRSLNRQERRSALVLDQEHWEFRRIGTACVPVNDMNIVRAFIEGLSWCQGYLFSTL